LQRIANEEIERRMNRGKCDRKNGSGTSMLEEWEIIAGQRR
jgi:hypothetical protein